MTTFTEAAEEFLSHQRIAVAGVSRDPKQPANLVYRRLREAGHEVFAVNPNADEAEGDPCFASVADLPVRVDGVVVVTTPDVAEQVVADCAAAGIERVWLHRGMGAGSVSDGAIAACREHDICVIPGGCPNMFGETSDAGHRWLCRMLNARGKLPRTLDYAPREQAPAP
jgi:uncharacterized protein